MRYICGNPWDDKDRKVREDAGRPVVNHDELNQYVNQAVNNLRQNKRGIKVEPGGNAAQRGVEMMPQSWYRTGPLYDVFKQELGDKAPEAYERFMQTVACPAY